MNANPNQGRAAGAAELLRFIDRSPSPWHVVDNVASLLEQQGYTRLREQDSWTLRAGDRHFVCRDGASLIAFIVGNDSLRQGCRLIGAHTDSPCLRVKSQGAHDSSGLLRLSTEVYGSPILATFSDRDLLLAGRLFVRDSQGENGLRQILLRLDDALVRLPNAAIHLNRGVNEEGLKLHKHSGLNLLLGALQSDEQAREQFRRLLARQAGVDASELLSVELCAVDAQAAAFFGMHQDMLSARALDNLASCFAAITALGNSDTLGCTQLVGLYDHEEVGSESISGAAGNFMETVLRRIAAALSNEADAFSRVCASSWHLSADMAHAFHPSHGEFYDGLHHCHVNRGVVLKMNASQRYATNANGEAFFREIAERAGVPVQAYVHRADLACGTTIGPVAAARLGIRTLDVGCAMWAMHSARESAGAEDVAHYVRFMQEFLAA